MATVSSKAKRSRRRPDDVPAASGRGSDAPVEGVGGPVPLTTLLHHGDAGTRQAMTAELQTRVGNTAVQRLVEIQRQPRRTPIAAGGGETRTPIAAGGGETRTPIAAGGSTQRVPVAVGPQPSRTPALELRATEAARRMATWMGQSFVGSMPTVTADDKALVARSNDYFQSSPLEFWERSSGEHLQKRNELTNVFQQKAHQLTLHIVSKSEQQAFSEWMRYSGDPGTDNEAAAQLREAATHLAKVQAEILQVSALSDTAREVLRGVPSVFGFHRDPMRMTGYEGLDDDLDKLEKHTFD